MTLLGDENVIHATAARLGLDLDFSKIAVIKPETSPKFEEYAETLFELRQHKNMAPAQARDLMTDVSYFGTMMVYKGRR